MGIESARPIKQETPTYSPAMMALLDAQCHVKREMFRDSYHRQELTRETVSRLKAELKAARTKFRGEHRRTMRHSKRSFQLDQDYVSRHNIDVDLYEAYVPGDELNIKKAAISAAALAAKKAALDAQNHPVAVAQRALAAAQLVAAQAAVAVTSAPVTPASVRTTPPQKTFSEDQHDAVLAELQSLLAS